MDKRLDGLQNQSGHGGKEKNPCLSCWLNPSLSAHSQLLHWLGYSVILCTCACVCVCVWRSLLKLCDWQSCVNELNCGYSLPQTLGKHLICNKSWPSWILYYQCTSSSPSSNYITCNQGFLFWQYTMVYHIDTFFNEHKNKSKTNCVTNNEGITMV
jgi:hypothetical protein